MFFQEIITQKRQGHTLAQQQIKALVTGISEKTISNAQLAAFSMAVCWRGLSLSECAFLTQAMCASGKRLRWQSLDGPVLDKHSTGGVGDTVSLILAPLLAACGGVVPMIAGRALGHTGGTIDKLEAIPGYDAHPRLERFQKVVQKVGCAIMGQTDEIAPVDKTWYALRDATGTVESLDLITASIVSKKLAAGLDMLAFDVKIGSGAFMSTYEAGLRLAKRLIRVAQLSGLSCFALPTDMGAPLSHSIGNAAEVRHAISCLKTPAHDVRLMTVTLALAAALLTKSGLCRTKDEAHSRLNQALSKGEALERFAMMVAEMGAPSDFIERMDIYLPPAPYQQALFPEEEGFVAEIDMRKIGWCLASCGRGISSFGITELVSIGEKVGPGQRPLMLLHAPNAEYLHKNIQELRSAVILSPAPPEPDTCAPLLYSEIGHLD